MKCVSQLLFLGDYRDALNVNELQLNNITRILSVCPMETDELSKEFVHCIIPIEDMEHVNIISHFENTFQFIQDSITSNRAVLVHCAAGVSRSVSIICAYLMKQRYINYEAAIAFIKNIEPFAGPNAGFIQQLNLYHEMNYTLNPHYPKYKQFRINTLANEYQQNGHVESRNLQNISPTQPSQTSLRCKKCRRVLALSESIIEHEPSTGQAQFQYFKRDNTELKACALLFLEPMDWMNEYVNAVEGKLMCPGCCSKIGAFNWYGMQCSCGSWQSPAFTIARKNVDEMKSLE